MRLFPGIVIGIVLGATLGAAAQIGQDYRRWSTSERLTYTRGFIQGLTLGVGIPKKAAAITRCTWNWNFGQIDAAIEGYVVNHPDHLGTALAGVVMDALSVSCNLPP